MFGDVGDALKVLVTRVTEVCSAEAEEDSHRAAVTTLVLQEISAVLGAHLHNNDIMKRLQPEAVFLCVIGYCNEEER